MRYHVSLDGAAGPDVELDHEPARDELIEIQERTLARVYEVVDGADGSKVINASWVGEVGESRAE